MNLMYHITTFVRKLIPNFGFRIYHYLLALMGHWWYGFPSEKIFVIGVTGTKGKTTTVAALAHVLEQAGFNVALTSTAFFQRGNRLEENTSKVGMPGRFFLPRFLSRAVQAGCQIAIIESTSEGVLQHRHRFINYDFFVFTNLRPEHIERHGSFEKYKQAKLELFRHLSKLRQKRCEIAQFSAADLASSSTYVGEDRLDSLTLNHRDAREPRSDMSSLENWPPLQLRRGGGSIEKGVVVNLDDEAAVDFLQAAGKVRKIGVTFQSQSTVNPLRLGRIEASSQQSITKNEMLNDKFQILNQAQNPDVKMYVCTWEDSKILYQATSYRLGVPGFYNACNVALASAAATLVGVPFEKGLAYSEDFTGVPGRFEVVRGNDVLAVIDYAHEPFSLEEVLKLTKEKFPGFLVHVFGATGGGRDAWKRPEMGGISASYADYSILTNDDPYDEDQMGIVNQILSGMKDRSKVEVVLDRRQAIHKGVRHARLHHGVVLITGKGSEKVLCLAKGERIPWSDRGVVEEMLKNI